MNSLYTEFAKKQSPKTRRSRKEVAEKMVEFVKAQESMSQRQWSEVSGVPRTTLQYWLKRKETLEESPVVKNFFEHPDGVAWLHRVIVAAHFVFTDLGPASIHNVSQFLELSGVDRFVGSCYGYQQKVATAIDQRIGEFARLETERLGKQMSAKKITLCEDETFHPEICLVAIEPISNFIIVEKYAEGRDGATWTLETQQALRDLPVEVIQSSSDEGKGLLNHVRTGLQAHHSPDTFHVVQELVRGTSSPIGSQIKKKQKAYEEASEKVEKVREGEKQGPREVFYPKGGSPGLENQLEEAKRQKEQAWEELKAVQWCQEKLQAAREGIGKSYHPYDLQTGVKQGVEDVAAELNRYFQQIRQVVREAGLSEKCQKHIEKAHRVVSQMVATIGFFFCVITAYVEDLGVSEELEKGLYEQLIPGFYLQYVGRKEKDKEQKQALKQTSERLLAVFRQRQGPFEDLDEEDLNRLERVAQECAGVFQRSSSCVEGRNAQLALRHRGLHRLSRRKLQALTGVHNYFLKRPDGTTAAERFFEAKPRDLFQWVLDHVDLPARPRIRVLKSFPQPLLKVS
jgi:hypothetical protein